MKSLYKYIFASVFLLGFLAGSVGMALVNHFDVGGTWDAWAIERAGYQAEIRRLESLRGSFSDMLPEDAVLPLIRDMVDSLIDSEIAQGKRDPFPPGRADPHELWWGEELENGVPVTLTPLPKKPTSAERRRNP